MLGIAICQSGINAIYLLITNADKVVFIDIINKAGRNVSYCYLPVRIKYYLFADYQSQCILF